MKKINIGLFTLVLMSIISQSGFCASSLGSKIKLQDASTVSKRANGEEGFGDNPFATPVINSALGGMSMMIQGMTEHPYSVQEQQKAQMDYARQQMEQVKQMDAEGD